MTTATHAPRPGSRADRARHPRATDVLRDTAIDFGVCVRPILLRRTDVATGETEIVETACGATRGAVCPPCADKARRLRAQQCRDGWHLLDEPILTADPATEEQRDLMARRARQVADDEPTDDTDAELADTGVRGGLDHGKRRSRSTRRRDDVPDLPRRPATAATLGRVFTDPKSGARFRPSLFVTLTLPSYGRVDSDGTPVHPARYDYRAAARDAIHFGKLLDRFAQNLRRVAGYDLQYFATIEPQRRAAPHAHYAIRGTLPRALVKQVVAATYVNVWWPPTERVVYDGARLPVWDGDACCYVDPDTGAALPTWVEAIDALDDGGDAEPVHTVRFGAQVDVQGLLAGSAQAEHAIGYLVKYLVKDLGDDLEPAEHATPTTRRADHVARLVEALRFEPCSPLCANWLRCGVQPKNPRPGMRPGCCRAKAHRPSHLGYGGRRVLVSRKWTAKDLADHRYDRRAHVLAALGRAADGESSKSGERADGGGGGVTWEMARPTDPDVRPPHQRLLRRIARAVRQRAEYHHAHDNTGDVAAQSVSDVQPGQSDQSSSAA